MKKYIPLLLAAVVFVLAILLLQPEAKVQVVVLTGDLPAGHILSDVDMAVREIPVSFRPSDAVEEPSEALGQTVKTDRSKGDILRLRHLGDSIMLQPGERAIAVRVDDASGLGGLIAPGDSVGLTAVIFGRDAAYSKVTMEFRSGFTQMQSSGSSAIPQERATEGIVVLAVPSSMIDVKYDFTFLGGSTTIHKVNAVELIAAITSSGNARIILYKLPQNPDELLSPGLYLPDLVIIPTSSPEATPSETPAVEP
jgi:pilus assembly protein CpaB